MKVAEVCAPPAQIALLLFESFDAHISVEGENDNNNNNRHSFSIVVVVFGFYAFQHFEIRRIRNSSSWFKYRRWDAHHLHSSVNAFQFSFGFDTDCNSFIHFKKPCAFGYGYKTKLVIIYNINHGNIFRLLCLRKKVLSHKYRALDWNENLAPWETRSTDGFKKNDTLKNGHDLKFEPFQPKWCVLIEAFMHSACAALKMKRWRKIGLLKNNDSFHMNQY